VPTDPVRGSVPLITSTGLVEIVIPFVAVSVRIFESVAVAATVNVPVVVGVPEITSVELDVPDAVIPGGKFATVHVYVPVPPVTASVE
jgi:hypothetical protein